MSPLRRPRPQLPPHGRPLAGALLAAAAAALAPGCNTMVPGPTSGQPVAVAPGTLFDGAVLSIRSPAETGWAVTEASHDGMTFTRHGPESQDTFVADVQRFILPVGIFASAPTPRTFRAVVAAAVAPDPGADAARFTDRQDSLAETAERGYYCLRHASTVRDTRPDGVGVGANAGASQPLWVETRALYCQHPRQATLGFAAIYTHRGPTPFAGLPAAADGFFAGVQVPPGRPVPLH